MSAPQSRLARLLSHFTTSSLATSTAIDTFEHNHHIHQLSPTFFLPRAAEVEPDALAIYHLSSNSTIIRRTYRDFADRARGLAYYIKHKGWRKVGILCPNTPAFLEAIFGIAAAGAVNVGVNYRLQATDVAYIFGHSDAEAIIVDAAYEPLLSSYRQAHPLIPILVDSDTNSSSGPYCAAILEGLQLDTTAGSLGWAGLSAQCADEHSLIALAYTSGTTGRPKGVEYTHRGAYLAALGNVIESGLAYHSSRARYLWTLPLFHAMGWTFPWAVTAARGTHYCLRQIDYPEIWRLLKEERITHFSAAPTVNTLLCADKGAQRLEQEVRPAHARAVRAHGGAEPDARTRLRPHGNVRPDHEGLPPPRLAGPGEGGAVPEDGEAGPRVRLELARAGHQDSER
ncbi:MAG: hypothetical protein LQ340_007542 [Diploschistes diacapsis]|nr:MAG: hypothetical protein LQ340_007542 [Diploschistes diacapsis]